jgi:hypothetical protein
MFSLKSTPNQDGSRLIYAHFNFNRNRCKWSTGLKIDPDQWDEKKERPKRTFGYYPVFKAHLDKWEQITIETYHDLTLTHIPSKSELVDSVRSRFHSTTLLVNVIKDYAETKKGKTKTGFEYLSNIIESFRPYSKLDEIDTDWFNKFKQHLYDKDQQVSTAMSYITKIKTVMQYAFEMKLTKNVAFKSTMAMDVVHASTKVFLTEEEIDRIASVDLPEKLKIYRDAFIVSCYTGTRHSDISKINKTNFVIGPDPYFRIVSQKTSDSVSIPAHSIVLDIMRRVGWQIPNLWSPDFNAAVKTICRLAKIEQDVVETKWPGGIRVDTVKKKYQMISVHTGRRSFVCNAIIAGIPHTTVMHCGGWKTYQAFSKYLKLSSTDNLKIAFRSDFFRNVKLKTV